MARGAPRRGMSPRPAAGSTAGLLLAVLFRACGYSAHGSTGRFPRGAEQIFVRPLEDRTTDAEAGALVAAALRRELARRGADGGPDAPARIEGAVERVTFGAPSPNNALYRLSLTVSTRLVVGGKLVAEQRTQRDEDWLAGQDPLESEGRRRLALRHAADEAAREIVERYELP
jgi:hypothetical protein